MFISPSVILTVTLGLYPILWALPFMFTNYKGYGAYKFIGFSNFERLIRDQYMWEAIFNTLTYAAGKLVLTLPIALALAVILNGAIRGRNLLRGIYFMPTVLSTAVMAVVFYIIFNSYNGLLNQVLKMIGIPQVAWLSASHAMTTVILIATWGAIGNYMLLFLAGLQGIPKDVYESAAIDGADGFKKFWYITIPMMGPILNIIVILAIMTSLDSYESIMVLTGGGPAGTTEVMYLYLFKLFFQVSTGETSIPDMGYGSAVAVFMALIVGAVTAVYFLVTKKMNNIY